jgi:tRNA(Arg) A34 adenosine deaminase TadA
MKSRTSFVSLPVRLSLPDWVDPFLKKIPPCRTDEEKMGLALSLARENVLRGTGGPFGAAVFREPEVELLSVGVNGVERLGNSAAHAEMLAIMIAEKRQGSYTLRATDGPGPTLFSSCEPCAMCLGAILWSGVSRLVCAAPREAALALGFEEGPVFPESYRYLEGRGVQITRGLLAEEGRGVLRLYREQARPIYNG